MSLLRLSDYKSQYKNAKKQSTKTKIYNKAFLNLPVCEFGKFAKWQNELENL